MTALYSCRSNPGSYPPAYTFEKFDRDLNVQEVYETSREGCSCPAGHRPKCKHRTMVPIFVTAKHVDDGWFLDWDTRLWQRPIACDAEVNEVIEDQLDPTGGGAASPPVVAPRAGPTPSVDSLSGGVGQIKRRKL